MKKLEDGDNYIIYIILSHEAIILESMVSFKLKDRFNL